MIVAITAGTVHQMVPVGTPFWFLWVPDEVLPGWAHWARYAHEIV